MDQSQENQRFVDYKYVIVGAGISGLQAALILAQNDQDFIILEADNRIGGRICSQSIKNVVAERCFDYDFQWFNHMKDFSIDFGATWVAKNQTLMKKMTKDFGINLFPQNYQALSVLAINEHQYHKLSNLGQYYTKFPQILQLLSQVQKLQGKITEFNTHRNKNTLSQQLAHEQKQFYTKYINMTGYDFILNHVKNQSLAKLLSNQYTTLQCIETDKINAIQLINTPDNFDNIFLYVGKRFQNIDGFRAKEGMHRICVQYKNEIQRVFDKKGNNKQIDQLIRLNHPVKKVLNDRNPVEVIVRNGLKIKCHKAIMCLPLATMGRIQYQNLSEGKKIIIEDTMECNMTRMSMVFKSAFWRSQYSGYMSFSDKFHMNELVDLTPEANQCGILAYVFTGSGFANWNKDVMKQCQNTEGQEFKKKWYSINKKKALKIIADIFFQGDLENQNLKQVIVFHGSMSWKPYITSSYQGISSPSTIEKLYNKGLDFEQHRISNEKNMIILGSDFADNDHRGFMQGAIRFSRKKIYAELQKEDPLHALITSQE